MFEFFLPVGLVSLLYLAIGSFINRNNARYLLAGYNTMSEEKRKKFPIDSYLVFFKKFFNRMSIFTLLSALFFYLIFIEQTAVTIWAIFQIIPYVYFVFQSLKY
tara:strand:- start:9 stop:320 length:312 start_codon:yes stop_codon:yes gene_type:complete